MIIYGHPDYQEGMQALREWIDGRLLRPVSKDSQFIGRMIDGRLAAVCAFAGWTKDDVELSLAADPGSGSIELVQAIFGYVFDQLGCARCTAKVRDDNHKSMRLIRRLGFKYEGRQRKASEGHDLLLYGLLRDEIVYPARKAVTKASKRDITSYISGDDSPSHLDEKAKKHLDGKIGSIPNSQRDSRVTGAI